MLNARGRLGDAMQARSSASVASIWIILAMISKLLIAKNLNSWRSLAFPNHYTFGLLPIPMTLLRTACTNAAAEQSNTFHFYGIAATTSNRFIHII
jgi:hypothetical protein